MKSCGFTAKVSSFCVRRLSHFASKSVGGLHSRAVGEKCQLSRKRLEIAT